MAASPEEANGHGDIHPQWLESRSPMTPKPRANAVRSATNEQPPKAKSKRSKLSPAASVNAATQPPPPAAAAADLSTVESAAQRHLINEVVDLYRNKGRHCSAYQRLLHYCKEQGIEVDSLQPSLKAHDIDGHKLLENSQLIRQVRRWQPLVVGVPFTL